jgi:hypothetical protein
METWQLHSPIILEQYAILELRRMKRRHLRQMGFVRQKRLVLHYVIVNDRMKLLSTPVIRLI